MAAELAKNKKKQGISSDIYTALLGMAFLTLAATTTLVCIYAQQMYETIFSIQQVP